MVSKKSDHNLGKIRLRILFSSENIIGNLFESSC